MLIRRGERGNGRDLGGRGSKVPDAGEGAIRENGRGACSHSRFG